MDISLPVNTLETHDRLIEFKKQSDSISEQVAKIIKERPFGNLPFYIWAHARTADDGFTKRLIWQPRLTKPKSQTNSMLFKVYPEKPDEIYIIWMIPDRSQWDAYNKGKMTESCVVWSSIQAFQYAREVLDAPAPDDLSDERVKKIYEEIKNKIKNKIKKDKSA